MEQREKLVEIVKVFGKLGFIAFGGPAAHIAMMEKEIVEKRQWIDQQKFLDLVGATNLIPGPNSTEMTMHCGHERAGWMGMFLAGMSFIFPAVILTGFLAVLYVEYGQVPAIEPLLYGIKPAVLSIILGAILKLGKKALKNWQLGVIGVLVIVAALLDVNEVTAILGAGVLGMFFLSFMDTNSKGEKTKLQTFLVLLTSTGVATSKIVSTSHLFWVFLKIGTVLFGSGYVLIAYLDGELVQNLDWLSQQELLDAVAMGQFTPGPVLSTATFIGYQVNGIPGALAATAGIFLPSFFFVLLLNPIVPKLRSSALASRFLDAVNIGAVGIMVAVTFELCQNILIDWHAWTIALVSTFVSFYFKKVSSIWIVVGGALLGYGLGMV